MKINIKKAVDLTPSLETYIEEKLSPLAKLIQHFDETGVAEIWLELSRTTKHHKKGEVYFVAADLRLPKKILRAEAGADDVRKAIDQVKDTLHMEIEKYRTQFMEHHRGKEK